jgi:hypothetical protein
MAILDGLLALAAHSCPRFVWGKSIEESRLVKIEHIICVVLTYQLLQIHSLDSQFTSINRAGLAV